MTEQTLWTSRNNHTGEFIVSLRRDDLFSQGRLLCITRGEGDAAHLVSTVGVPDHIANALLLAVDLGPDAQLADIAPLLAQMDREDASGVGDMAPGAFLYTREIRRLLGQKMPCTRIERALGGARCALPEHEDGWHVDPERRLRWRFADPDAASGALDVRGWTPEDGPVGSDTNAVALLVSTLNDYRVPVDLEAPEAKEFLRDLGLVPTGPDRLWDEAQRLRVDPR